MRIYKVKGMQDFIKSLGSEGCFMLSIILLSGRTCDILDAACLFIEKGWLKYNFDNPLDKDNFLVLEHGKMYSFLTGANCKYYKTDKKPKGTEPYIEEWYNPRTEYTHFLVPGKNTLLNSVTVKEGFVRSYRVFETI